MKQLTFAADLLAKRGVPATVGTWPSAAVTAGALARQTSRDPRLCPLLCSTATCAPPFSATTQQLACVGTHRSRAPAAGRPASWLAAATAPAAAPTTGAPATCDPATYQPLSLLILLQECTRRAYNRPLLQDCPDLLALPSRLDELHCCVVLLAPAPRQLKATEQLGLAAAASTAPQAAGASRDGAMAGRGALQVTYLNLAAAEALKVPAGMCAGSATGGGGGGGIVAGSKSGRRGSQGMPAGRWAEWPLLDLDLEAQKSLAKVMAAAGEPKPGAQSSLRLRTHPGEAARGGADAVPSQQQAIHCPEALVLGLMSPNGACAGVALLFDRWQVQEEGGAVVLEGRPLVPELAPGSLPSDASLAELQEGVRAQADAVRALKARQGLTNQEPQVVSAVAELQRLKAEMELQQRLQSAFSMEAGVLRQLVEAGRDT